jgi:hypothetical protein
MFLSKSSQIIHKPTETKNKKNQLTFLAPSFAEM